MELKNFLTSIFSTLDLSEETVDSLTSGECLELFKTALTHSSIEPSQRKNYESLEFLGDGVLRSLIVFYIYQNYVLKDENPSVDTASKIKIHLEKKRTLAREGIRLGLMNYVNMSNKYAIEILGLKGKEDYSGEKEFSPLSDELRAILVKEIVSKVDAEDKSAMSLMEDLFEAFIGALNEAVLKIIPESFVGPNFSVIYTLLERDFFSKQKMKAVKDVKSKIKEIVYDKNYATVNGKQVQWSKMNKKIPEVRKEGDLYVAKYYLFNNQGKETEVLAMHKDKDQRTAEYTAAEKALAKLESGEIIM